MKLKQRLISYILKHIYLEIYLETARDKYPYITTTMDVLTKRQALLTGIKDYEYIVVKLNADTKLIMNFSLRGINGI